MFGFEHYTPLYDESEFKDEISEQKPYSEPSKIQKSTATIITSFNQQVNVDILANFLSNPDFILKSVPFMNQVTFSIRVSSRFINTKIFGSGTIHMTGGRCISEAKRAVKKLIKLMSLLKIRVIIQGDKKYKHPKYIYALPNMNIGLDDFKFTYRMCNRTFNTNFNYCPGSLYNILKEKKLNVTYDPNRYPGVCVKMEIDGVSFSFMLQKSGKSTISLKQDISVCKKAYKFINKIFKEHYKEITTPKCKVLLS